jgi:hypothetical protein
MSQKILQFDLNKKFIKEYDGSGDASRQTGINRGSICSAGGSNFTKIAGGFYWKYLKSQKIIKMNLRGKYIKMYLDWKEASEETGIKAREIISCVYGKQEQAGGFRWGKYERWGNGWQK